MVLEGRGRAPELNSLQLDGVNVGRQYDEHLRRRVAVACQPIDPVGIFVVIFGFPGWRFRIVVIPVKMSLTVIVIGVIGMEMPKRGLAEGDQQTERNREMEALAHVSFSLLLLDRIE